MGDGEGDIGEGVEVEVIGTGIMPLDSPGGPGLVWDIQLGGQFRPQDIPLHTFPKERV